MVINKEMIMDWLQEVKDPEIPVLSLIDLGVITDVSIDNDRVKVSMTPTFIGCPALDYMKKDVEDTLKRNGIDDPEVEISYEEPWNSNKITEEGRKALKKFGLAPPPKHNLIIDLEILEHVNCPYCESKNTSLKSPFGPTLCRSLHYCNDCKQAFEQFKPV